MSFEPRYDTEQLGRPPKNGVVQLLRRNNEDIEVSILLSLSVLAWPLVSGTLCRLREFPFALGRLP